VCADASFVVAAGAVRPISDHDLRALGGTRPLGREGLDDRLPRRLFSRLQVARQKVEVGQGVVLDGRAGWHVWKLASNDSEPVVVAGQIGVAEPLQLLLLGFLIRR
jgi:hypothetical protein